MTRSLLAPEAMSCIGVSGPRRTGVIAASDIRKFCAAVDEHNPVYLDEEAAHAAGFAGIVAPPLFNAAALRPVPFRSGLMPDGQYDFLAPPGLERLQTMLAGQSWEFLRPTIVGERIGEAHLVRSITERQGRTGPVVFVEREALVTTDKGEPVERYCSTLILREPPPPLPPLPSMSPLPFPAPRGGQGAEQDDAALPRVTEWQGETLVKRPDMISLFMFAAAIWAVHRIHWDTPYARQEGLPAPILPGWMVASYLAQRAVARAPAGTRLGGLALRYRAMAHPGDTLSATGRNAHENALDLVLHNQSGTVIVDGSARFVAT